MSEVSFDEVLRMGFTAQRTGRWEEARYYYELLLPHLEDDAPLHHLHAVVLWQLQENDAAVNAVQRAIGLAPEVADFYNTLGEIERSRSRLEAAEEAYARALELRPDYPEALTNRGLLRLAQGKLDEAEQLQLRALRLAPESPVILNNLGSVFQLMRRATEALDCFRRALKHDEGYVKARLNLIRLLLAEQHFRPALDEVAIAESRPFPPALAEELCVLKCKALQGCDRTGEAVPLLQALVKEKPEHQEALVLLASCYHRVGQVDPCLETYDRLLELNPHHAQAAYARLTTLNYAHGHEAERMWEAHRDYIARFHPSPEKRLFPVWQEHARPRVAYMSNDFRNHSVARFILAPMREHDRERFEIHGIALNETEDATTLRFQVAAEHWHKAHRLTDEELVELVREKEIDLLIDLGGLFGGRLNFLQRQAVPVQACFLGYPNTTGLEAVHYRFTDKIADPVGMTDPYFTETLLRLSGCAWSYAPIDAKVEIGELPSDSRPYFTFGSFHGVHKFRPDTMRAWARILAQVPDSLLIIKSFKGLSQQESRAAFHRYFHEEGVSLQRIKFVPSSASEPEHLSFFNQLDLALDTFPYNGTTITCEGLWMGVPSITLAGQTHVSRVGASLMTHAGLPECVANSHEEYVQRAVAWAQDRERLREVRRGLRERMLACELGDARRYARSLEECWHSILATPSKEAT